MFKCGDTFTTSSGNINPGTITGFTIDAYGGCQGTQVNRPIFIYTGASTSNMILLMAIGSLRIGDARFLNFDCESTTQFNGQGCINFSGNSNVIPYQITMFNLNSANLSANFYWSHGAQFALIGSTALNQSFAIGTFVNIDGNGTGTWTGSPISNINYQAIIGNFLAGTGDVNTGNGTETLRISACQMCVFSNNTFKDASTQGAVFKLFESNNAGSGGSQLNFAGIPVQYVQISDNLLTGKSGAQLGEISPQNTCNDERFFDTVVERNLFQELFDNLGSFMLLSGQRMTMRDNVFYGASGFTHPSFFNVQIAGRTFQTGSPGNGCPSNPTGTVQAAQFIEFYNNTSYVLSFHSPQAMIAIDNLGLGGAPASNSIFSNNLFFSPAGSVTVDNNGSGNSFGTNTANANTPNNPLVKNYSGLFNQISDFKPTANFSGGTSQPGVIADALGVNWSPTWDLGAVKH